MSEKPSVPSRLIDLSKVGERLKSGISCKGESEGLGLVPRTRKRMINKSEETGNCNELFIGTNNLLVCGLDRMWVVRIRTLFTRLTDK